MQRQPSDNSFDTPIASTARIEAFSDGVIAIAITILVLELRVPELGSAFTETQMSDLVVHLLPKIAAYLLSFLLIAIYWVNHHHMFHLLERADSGLLWANNNLLLWLSLLSFPTSLLGEHPSSKLIAAAYGGISFMAALGFYLLHRHAFSAGLFSKDYSERAYRDDARANLMTLSAYLLCIALSFVYPYAAEVGYALIALMYFLPRIHAR